MEVIRRRRRRKSPRSARPSLDALAAEFQVHPWTIWKAIHGRPPYAYKAGAQEPLPSDQRKAPHRKRRPGT